MDTTKEYQSMCVEATEIQEPYNPAIGDFAIRSCEYENYRVGLISWRYDRDSLWWSLLDGTDGITLNHQNSQAHFLERLIWLPRQDQLQKMVMGDKPVDGLLWLLEDFYTYCRTQTYIRYDSGISFEKLWLGFLMKVKFNKTWNGNEWLKIEDKESK